MKIGIGFSCSILALTMLCGCQHHNARRGSAYYVENGDMISGEAAAVTMYDLDSAAQSMMRRLRENGTFRKHYDALKAKIKDRLPIVAVGKIADLSGQSVQSRLDSLRNEVSTSFYESQLFLVRDDTVGETLHSRIGRNITDGLENGALEPVLKSHPEPDYLFAGDFRRFQEPGGYFVYRLHFSLQDLSSGLIMWEGEETVVKHGPFGIGCRPYGSRCLQYRSLEPVYCPSCSRFHSSGW